MRRNIKLTRALGLAVLGVALLSNTAEAAVLKTVNKNNTNLVPLRTISEELGAKVGYDGPSKKITVSYNGSTVEATVGSKSATVNGAKNELQVAPQVIKETTYVPIRFIGEALGGVVNYQKGILTITFGDEVKEWKLETIVDTPKATTSGNTFSSGSKTVAGKRVTYVEINMNDPKVKVKVATPNNTVTQVQPLKTLGAGAKAAVNGTYFAAYNGDLPLPDGTVSASVNQLKDIVSGLGLKSAMCLDGGASSGLYYNGSYLTSPGRNLSNSLNFYY